MRDSLDRLHIIAYVFAGLPITAGDGLDKCSGLIDEFHAQSIELRLYTICNFSFVLFVVFVLFDQFSNSLVPFSDILGIIGIFKRC